MADNCLRKYSFSDCKSFRIFNIFFSILFLHLLYLRSDKSIVLQPFNVNLTFLLRFQQRLSLFQHLFTSYKSLLCAIYSSPSFLGPPKLFCIHTLFLLLIYIKLTHTLYLSISSIIFFPTLDTAFTSSIVNDFGLPPHQKSHPTSLGAPFYYTRFFELLN